MAMWIEFAPVELSQEDQAAGLAHATEAGMLEANPLAWVGFAAEHALMRSINAAGMLEAREANALNYDLLVRDPRGDTRPVKIEVKVRACTAGWTHPPRFDYVFVPTHDGREPVKEAADVVLFCWWSADDPSTLWVLGRLMGAAEFKRRAVFYREGEDMPNGRQAAKGGAYAIEVRQLRPVPRAMLREAAWRPAS